MSEYEKQQALNDAREQDQAKKNERQNNNSSRLRNGINTAKRGINAVKSGASAVKEAWGIAKQVKAIDMAYAMALIAAMLKDILDMIGLTGFGYLIVIVFTFMISLFIMLMVIMVSVVDSGSSKKSIKSTKGFIKKAWALILGTTTELLPGIDLVPIETLTVIALYVMVLMERKENSQISDGEPDSGETQESYA